MRIKTKEDRRERIKYRIRKRMTGSAQKPRLSVFRSVSHIYVQVIDDRTGQTVASASSVDAVVKGQMPPDGKPFQMTIEARPGGRWYRDLGNDAGHFWGHVQVIKPPTLLELCGPMFVSYPSANHLQYRLSAEGDARKRLRITHRAFGYFPKNFIEGANEGWLFKLKRIGEIAEQIKRGGRKGALR